MEAYLLVLFAAPLCASAFTALLRNARVGEILTVVSTLLLSAVSCLLMVETSTGRKFLLLGDEFIVDSLTSLMLVVISFVSLMVSLYSPKYLAYEVERGVVAREKVVLFYVLLNAFIFTMILVVTTNNIAIMWVALEATTIATAHLVATYRTAEAIEASWKYIILCSTGIAFGLYGVVTLYYTAYLAGIPAPLLWTSLVDHAKMLEAHSTMVKIAFTLALVGFGTKAGLAPFHTWLPDTYSEAPPYVSALLASILEGCAIYTLVRFYSVSVLAGVGAFAQTVLLVVGIASLFISSLHMLAVTDVNRLFALSSVEHMGIIACALGFGGYLGALAAVFHVVNHALVKSALFLSSGLVTLSYGTRKIEGIRGMMRSYPALGALVLAGAYAIIGGPPFGTFQSELLAIMAGVKSGNPFALVLFLAAIVVAFAALLVSCTNMVFGEPASSTEKYPHILKAPITILLLLSLLLGVYIPEPLRSCLENAGRSIVGGGVP
ncbi:proton-conducting transporter transmembrane domain-containing protein [Thermofilum pendens]|uniref:NADH dehydrogenase (Quinone) n=1 Tax=Thermofilum pendens (strain DSM 2475 / Hrk 5) TaxID=368408 RepID=A1RWL5_THEPD|nr:proton-conducting transporter membrane subunit [Thermofilum pendens]ABL77595.1 NADH dehydrogenase (quinone) [Thermofilum pendens Hrk 5]